MGLLDLFKGKPSKDKFAQLVMEGLRNAGESADFEYDPEEFVIAYDGDKLINLANVYNEYCAAPRSLKATHLSQTIRAFLSQHKELPELFEDVSPDLFPKLWSRATLEAIRFHAQLEGRSEPNIPHELIGEHLAKMLVYDLPEAVRTIDQKNLDSWGKTYYEAMEVARQNLAESEFAMAQLGESLYASLTGDTYDATRLLRHDLVEKLTVKGQPIAMVPNRDHLLITGEDDPEGLEMMIVLAEKALQEPRPMSVFPLRWDGDMWVDWFPNADHPLYDRFHTLAVEYMNAEYASQKENLDRLCEQRGEDVFIASYLVLQVGERLTSCATWAKGCDTLLPKAHTIALGSADGGTEAMGPWNRVMEVAGDQMELTEHYPARYRVREFPTPEQLAAIGTSDP